jgi:hypothetical protein
MRRRSLILAVAFGILFPPKYLVTTQTTKPAKGPASSAKPTGNVPRTPDGHPDLRGQWDYNDAAPLERPDKFAGKETLSPEEAKAAADERAAASAFSSGPRNTGYDTRVWFERGKVSGRTSLIVDPPDGKQPPLTPEGQKRAAARREANQRRSAIEGAVVDADGPEDRSVGERCLVGDNSGPPMKPVAYNHNVAIFQAPDYVSFVNESIHIARIVPLDGRPRPSFRGWIGQSRGRWEGDTLVVETTNYRREAAEFSAFGASENLRVVEHFTRLGPETLRYEFTIDDPTTWTKPWTARIDMKPGPPMYEYACHEGNYSLRNILMNARALEKAAPSKK